MVNFGPLTAKISWRVLGTPANFNGFRALASLLHQQGQPNFARRLPISLAGTLYIHLWGLLPPNGIFLGTEFTAYESFVLLYWQHYCTVLEQWASAKFCGVVQRMELQNFRSSFSTGCHLNSERGITLGIGPHSSYFRFRLQRYYTCKRTIRTCFCVHA